MFNKELFVKYHWKQVLGLGVLVILVVAGQVVVEDTHLFNQDSRGVVKGQATADLEAGLNQQERQAILDYQNNLKHIVRDYFEQRAEFNQPHQDWLFLINNVKYRLLDMSVPTGFKDLQTQLITTLDAEREAISGASQVNLEQVNQRWLAILEQYFWLND